MERSYAGLTPGAIPSPGLLGFQARSVTITSGANFVSSASQSFPTVPPGVIGYTINLIYPQTTPDFVITAAPPGQQLIGPASQVYSQVDYFDYEQQYNPGIPLLSQSVEFTAGGPPANQGTVLATGLARAMTLFIWSQSGGNGEIVVAGNETNLAVNVDIVDVKNVPYASFAFGAGTTQLIVPSSGLVGVTYHLFPSFIFFMTVDYFYSARLYF